MNDNCPKCGAIPVAAVIAAAEWACGSYVPHKLKVNLRNHEQSDSCRIAQLETQLADARLLARAVNNGSISWDEDGMSLFRDGRYCEIVASLGTDGLPILTDELRAALKGAVGE
jgi:hypothetical protein